MFKKYIYIGLVGLIFPALYGGCPCCGTANCCSTDAQVIVTKEMIQDWLNQPLDQIKEQPSLPESTSDHATVEITNP